MGDSVRHSVRFGKIRYHNFMSFAEQEWDFSSPGEIFLISGRNADLHSDHSGVAASNGSGKTNLVQGLMYALYGQFPYKIHNANLANTYCKGLDQDGYAMSVTLHFEISGDEEAEGKYKVVRGCPKRANAAVQLTLFQEKDGAWQDISKSSSALTQEHLQKLLRLDMPAFQRLVMLSFDPAYNFFRMSAAQKRDFIQMLFDTSVYTAMWELVKKDIARFELSLQGEKVKWNVLQGQLADCEEKIKEYAKNAKAQQKELDAQIDGIVNKILKDLEAAKVVANMELEEGKVKLNEVLGKVEANMAEAAQTKSKLSGGRQAIAAVQDKLAGYQREIAKHQGILKIICEDCAAKVRAAYKLDEYEQGVEDCNKRLEAYTAEVNRLQAEVDRLTNELMGLGDARISAERACKAIEDRLITLGMEETDAKSRIKYLEQRKEEIQRSMDNPKDIPMLDTYKKLKSSISECDKSIKGIEEEVDWLQLCEKAVSPEGIRKNIVVRVVKNINELINRYLEELNTAIRCELDDQLDKYTIYAPGKKSMDLHNLSMGEQMKLLLASQLAFRKFLFLRLGVSCNCFILDEIVDRNFDTLSISRILNMLLDLAKTESTHIYIISHRSEVSRLADDLIEENPESKASVHRMLVEKTNNISAITAVD